MSATAARRLAIAALITTVTFIALDLTLLRPRLGVPSSNGAWDVFYLIVFVLAGPTFGIAGTTIVVRQPRNTIGWLLLAVPLLASFAFFVGDYATYAFVASPGAPLGLAAAWIDRWAIVPTLCLMIPLFLLFPDGRVPSRRWRPVLWLVLAAPILTALTFALTPGRMTGAFATLTSVHVDNPTGIPGAGGVMPVLSTILGFTCVLGAFLSGAALIVRFRGRRGDERQQIKWLAFVGVAFLIELTITPIIGVLLGDSSAGDAVGDFMFAVMFVTLGFGIPIACAVAILKYRLYDLDIVVRKTIVVGALAVFVTAVYASIVAGIGTAVGARGSTKLSFVAAVALAILFHPARDRARRLADRLVYGKRATPYEVLSEFSERVADAYSTEDVLPRMARLLAEGTGATQTRVWLRVGSDLVPAAAFPSDGGALNGAEDEATSGEGAIDERASRFPVVHLDEPLGVVTVRLPASDPLTPPKQTLIRDFVAQAGPVLRNVRLVEDLKASRARLIATRDRERRTLERNIHDGAQQQLVALAIRAKLAGGIARGAGAQDTERLLDEARAGAQAALEELRDVARGIYPPLLADRGLVAALEAQSKKAALPVRLEAEDVARYPQAVEATVYFCAVEALRNVTTHAHAGSATIRLAASNGTLEFGVVDDGVG
ncbi:MAG TPA: histidine kinase, partial [Actinomycetota bacterium]